MTRQLILAPEAEAEIEAVLETVQRNPQQYQAVFRDLRRAPLRRFPFSVMYILSESEIVVLACIHG